ncbi:FAD-binding dehydrogenase [Actinomadura sp. NBRC 104412]|uniref:FAD-dependent oxidoreductase n=1 Tax=Actinomadura sp. NBRC 104412 TaxID=3032203 RepID=UPI0024A5990B|nr:FAD-dependent oxidoreductase [Actinomadura sp. NBRC 104412]GLZ02611.1 FAD-binding dehydrogenase [Actinomadura sp. NBRC 104412]
MYHSGDFDESADVVVVGFGVAGATVALTAQEQGAEVVVLDKQPADDRRPNSRYSGGFLMVLDDPEAAITYLTALYEVTDDPARFDAELIRTWAEEVALNPRWLDELGCSHAEGGQGGEHRSLPGWETVGFRRVLGAPEAGGSLPGCPLFGFLDAEVARRGIERRYSTRARWLLTDADGAVIGVEVEQDGRVRRIGARRGVVLATGGYEASEELKRRYFPVPHAYFYGTERNTGDGITMAMEVGAELWHMNGWPGHLVAHFEDCDYTGGFHPDYWATGRFALAEGNRPYGTILVDGSGARFTCEPGVQHAANLEVLSMDAGRLTFPRIPVWWVFGEDRMQAGPLVSTRTGPAGPVGDYAWSKDNTAELSRGWVRSGDGVAGLARECGFDEAVFSGTVETYNEACATGRDPFGRPVETLAPLTGERLYAMPLYPGGSHTVGGPRRDARARVLSVRGGPIPGLYSAGELGSMHGLLYPNGGASLAECLAFGRIAGRQAAARDAGTGG